MKKKAGITIAAVLAGLCLTGGVYAANTETASAAELPSVTLENSGDAFLLTGQSYTADESFVYTTTACFENGQAAALVFGASETEESGEYWAFNVDRKENSVKLIYFYKENGNLKAVELLRDWYIGNDKMTDGEKSLVNPKVETIDKVQLKVVVSVDGDNVYGEFYADNIRRFGVDNEYKLNEFEALPEGVEYDGGFLGYNCFNAKIRFEETHYAESDYTYYTEAYRQQYHYSQYAHWNNDPNGLVYYNGYYHLYYQHHPYALGWGDMYWGHARSQDLVHWELLPICLFPDTEADGWGPGNGYMWSGSAMVYRRGMSDEIDSRGWFPNGNGEGLIAYYTRDGGMQDQVLMSSDDGGMTWTKRVRIPQTIVVGPGKTDCRDPKVFPVEKNDEGKVTLWGMAVTGMATGDIWFMKSTDLVNWTAAGGFKGSIGETDDYFRSECPDVVFVKADDGTTRAVLTLTARNYLVGDIAYDAASGQIKFLDLKGNDVSQMPAEEVPYQTMDYGPDSYATQSFYIDDKNSEYYGKTIAISWFSGIPRAPQSIESGSLAANRKTWNGGGFTIPVEYSLVKTDEGYLLAQTPITTESDAFDKTDLVSVSNTVVDQNSENLLQPVASRTIEISATIANPNEEHVYFRVQSAGNEYTEIGWTKADGYYVDRTHTYNGGLTMPNYHVRYKSGAVDGQSLQFYILADNGGVEVFCNGGTIPFYVLTFAAPYSVGASFHTTGEVTVEELSVNHIASIWRDESVKTEDTMLYISQENVELSKNLTNEKEVTVYATSGGEVEWTIESGEDVVSVTPTSRGAIIKALKVGTASILVTCGNAQKTVSVSVYDGTIESDVAFDSTGIISGDWLMTANGIVGNQAAGDGFLLSQTYGADFTYSAKFDLGGGAAAAVIFRASPDMSDYYIANYDKNGNIVKLWTPYGELANVPAGDVDASNVTLTVTAKRHRITVDLNGRRLVDVTDSRENAPLAGVFGLNVCATRAVFKAVGLQKDDYTYSSGDFMIQSAVEQGIVAIYNDTLGTVKISREFYSVKGRNIKIYEEYFATLANTGVYEFTVQGKSMTFTVKVNVTALPEIWLQNLILQEGVNAVFFIGNEAITSVKVRGEILSEELYRIKNGALTIDASALIVGDNEIELSDTLQATVTVEALSINEKTTTKKSGCKSSIGIGAIIPLGAMAIVLIRGKKDENND